MLNYLEYGEMEQVDLSKLKYAYAEVLGGDPFLFLFDHRQWYISGLLKGFDTVYRQLSVRFGFDDTVFYKVTGQTNDMKKRIWLKNIPVITAFCSREMSPIIQMVLR